MSPEDDKFQQQAQKLADELKQAERERKAREQNATGKRTSSLDEVNKRLAAIGPARGLPKMPLGANIPSTAEPTVVPPLEDPERDYTPLGPSPAGDFSKPVVPETGPPPGYMLGAAGTGGPETAGKVRAALDATAADSAEQEATISRLATLTGQTPAALRGLGAEKIQKMARELGVLSQTQNTPVLRRKYTEQDFARLAADDVKPLSDLEAILRKDTGNPLAELGKALSPKSLMNTGSKVVPNAPQALFAGAVDAAIQAPMGLVQGASELLDEFLRSPPSPFLAVQAGERGAQLRETVNQGPAPKDENAMLPRVAAWAEANRKYGAELGDSLQPQTGDFAADAILSGVRSTGSSLPWLVAAAATANPGLAVGGLTATTGGVEYGRARDEGLAPFAAGMYAGTQASIEALTETLPVHVLLKDITDKTPFGKALLTQMATEIPGEQVATLLQDLNEWVTLNPEKTVGEFMAERPGAALQTLIATVATTGLQTSIVKGADVTVRAMQKAKEREDREAKIAEGGLDSLDALMAAATESKLRERDPERFAQTIQEMAADSPLQQVYMSPEAFAQAAQSLGETPEQLATRFGVQDQIEASLASGASIAIPLGTFTEKVAGMENTDVFTQNVAASPVGLSREEIKAIPEAQRERLVAQAEKLAQEVAGNEEFAAGVEAVRTNLEQQLKDTGRFVGEPNRLYSQLAANGYASLAKRLGVTPEQAFQQFPLNIVGERVTAGSEALEQTERLHLKNGREILSHKNPTGRAMARLLENSTEKQLRGLLTDSEILVWDAADAIHGQAAEAAGIQESPGGIDNRMYVNKDEDGYVRFDLPYNLAMNPAILDHPVLSRYLQDDRVLFYAGSAGWLTGPEMAAELRGETYGQGEQAQAKVLDFLDQNGDNMPLSEIAKQTGTTAQVADRARKAWREESDALSPNNLYDTTRRSATQARAKRAKGRETVQQGNRGEYAPSKAQLALLRTADLSTFLHEIGHHFLEVHVNAASGLLERVRNNETLAPGEQELLDDVQSLLTELKVAPGEPGPGQSYAQANTLWALEFYENYIPNATDASVKELFDKLLAQKKLPVIRLFRTSAGRIVAFPGAEYSHADARMLLGEQGLPDAELRMEHGMYEPWNKGGLKGTRWYDTSGKLKDTDSYAQVDTASFRAARNATPEQRGEWYDEQVEEVALLGGAKQLRLRSTKEKNQADIRITVKPSSKEGGRFTGASVDMTFNGQLLRLTEGKPSPEQVRAARVVFTKTIVALQAYAERYQPDYLVFTGSGDAQAKFYDFVLRNFDMGYEARIETFHDIMVDPRGTTAESVPVFTLVKPERAYEFALELSNAEIVNDLNLLGEPILQKRRRVTEVVRPGSPVASRGGPGADATGAAGGRTASGVLYQSIPREERFVEEGTLKHAQEQLSENEYNAFIMARNGASNEEIAIELGGAEATVSPENVKVWLSRVREKGFIVDRASYNDRGLSPDTMRVIAMSAQGVGPKAIAEAVYPERDVAKAALQVRVLRNRHKSLIEQYKQHREGVLGQGPVFYSALKRAVEKSSTKSAPAAQWKATLKQTPGVKQEEIEWTGLFDWLDSLDTQSIPREDLVNFLDANGVKVEEVAKNNASRESAIADRASDLETEFEDNFYGNGEFEPTYFAKQYPEESDHENAGRWYVAWDGISDNIERGRDVQDTYDTKEEAQDAADEANHEAEAEAYQDALGRQNFERQAEDEIGEGVQFDSLTLPGGTDYTELLLTLPDIKGPATHWDEPNVVAHVRFKTRQGANGERVLAIEEVQSDWHQKGRTQGYANERDDNELADALDARREAETFAQAAQTKLREYLKSIEAAKSYEDGATQRWAGRVVSAHENEAIHLKSEELSAIHEMVQTEQDARLKLNELSQRVRNAEAPAGIPNAPFKNNGWAALVLKRMVRWAAEHGFDSVAWTPGEVQAERYDLGKVAETLFLTTLPDGTEMLEVQTTDDRVLNFAIGDQSLEDHVGVEAAKALRAKEPYELKGYQDGRTRRDLDVKDLRIGEGRGMLAFYDRILVNEANKLGKKYGAVAGETAIFPDIAAEKYGESQQFHSLPITPELKAAALEGMPLFQPENPLTPEERKFFNEAMRNPERVLPPGATPLDVWNALSFAEKTPFHETFARLTEAYFLEGKAPTPKLRGMFNKFRQWLLNVYESIKDLAVELTPEVTGILDRMYAAAEDIAEANLTQSLQPLFTVKPEYMTDAEWQDYQTTNANAVEEAEATLTQRSMRDMKWLSNARSKALRRLQAEAKQQRKAVGAEVAAEVMAERVNIARNFLARGVGKDGKPVDAFLALFDPSGQLVSGVPKLSTEGLEQMYADDPSIDWRKLGFGKYGMLAKNGIHPDALATVLGYASGDQLVRDLLTAEPAKEKISGVTDQRMLERYGDLVDDASIARAADEAVHDGLRARVLASEYAAITNAMGERKLINEAAKQAAERLVQRMPASKLNPAKFLGQERRAGRAAEEALRKNDLAGAAAAKRDQILNFHIAREVYARQKERDAALNKFRQILAAKRDTVAKSRNFDLVQASRAILAAYGMARMKNDVMSYLDAVKRYDPQLYASLEPTLIQAITTRKTLADLSVEQFLGLRDVVLQLWDLSRQEKLVEINGQSLELKDVTDQLAVLLEQRGADGAQGIAEAPTAWQRTLRMGEGVLASLRRVEAWARLMDGAASGPFTKFVWRPVSQAATNYRVDLGRYIGRFRELFTPMEAGLTATRIAAPELGYTFSGKAEMLHAILHTGNESNKRKLLLGRKWGRELQDGTVDTTQWDRFTARMVREGVLAIEDYQFAQGIWDLLEEIKPLAQQAHRRVFGRYFAEITANPVQTPFGEFRGGYVPAIYDDYYVTEASMRAAQDALESNDSSMFPAPGRGFTNSRVEYNQVMQLDLRLLGSHIDKVLKFAHMAGPVRDVQRILNAKSVSRLLDDLQPAAREDMLTPWLVRSARQTNEMPIGGKAGRAVSAFANGLRRRASMGLMFANVVNVLQQPTGLFNAIAFKGVKKRYMLQAMARYLRNPKGVHEAVVQASKTIETRATQQAVAMRDAIDTIVQAKGKYEKAVNWFERHTYFAQVALQNVQDTVVWLGAYESAKESGQTEAEAVQFADGVVRQTQGDQTPEGIARIETGTGWHKILLTMYGYFNMWGNQLSTEFRTAVRDLGLARGKSRMLYVYMVGFMAPALLAQLLADAIRGDLPDDEDEPLAEWLAWFFGTQVKTAAAMVPIGGPTVMAGVNAWNDKPYDDRVLSSPAISVLETGIRVPLDVWDVLQGDGDLSRTTKDTLTLLTLMTGLPFQALARPLGYAADVLEGDTQPADAVDAARGAVAGR